MKQIAHATAMAPKAAGGIVHGWLRASSSPLRGVFGRWCLRRRVGIALVNLPYGYKQIETRSDVVGVTLWTPGKSWSKVRVVGRQEPGWTRSNVCSRIRVDAS